MTKIPEATGRQFQMAIFAALICIWEYYWKHIIIYQFYQLIN